MPLRICGLGKGIAAINRQPVPDPSAEPLTSRADGEQLLFGAARDIAGFEGHLSDPGVASFEHAKFTASSCTLRQANGDLIARIPLHQVRGRLGERMAIARQRLARPLADLPGQTSQDPQLGESQLRLLDQPLRALAWAIGTGESFPHRAPPARQRLITAGLLLACVLPGLWYMVQRRRQHTAYQQELRVLVERWRSEGRPAPPEAFFELYNARR